MIEYLIAQMMDEFLERAREIIEEEGEQLFVTAVPMLIESGVGVMVVVSADEEEIARYDSYQSEQTVH